MEDCCEAWALGEAKPNQPREGTFAEIQECPRSGARVRLTFEGLVGMGEDFKDFAVLEAKYP